VDIEGVTIDHDGPVLKSGVLIGVLGSPAVKDAGWIGGSLVDHTPLGIESVVCPIDQIRDVRWGSHLRERDDQAEPWFLGRPLVMVAV